MKWNRLTIKTITEAEDMIICTLAELGLEGAEIRDSQPLTQEDLQQMFVDIVPEMPEDDGTAYLSFYLEEGQDPEKVRLDVEEALSSLREFMDIGEGSIELSETEDKDWINNWKEYFHQFYVDDILIIPSWEEPQEETAGKMVLHIDPGTAFGTGMHETTQMVIRQLKKRIAGGEQMLDVGTGSGILGIAALKLGAAHVDGTDLDPCAENAVLENLEANGIPEGAFDLVIGNLIDDPKVQDFAGKKEYDLVTANIQTPVLLLLTPVVKDFLKTGGLYITSGILDTQTDTMKEALVKAGFTIEETVFQGEWASIAARKV